jgi:hypothetical protein
MKWINKATDLDASMSAPCSINSFTTRSFSPNKVACNSNTPSRTELIGYLCKRAYLTSPIFLFVGADGCRRFNGYIHKSDQ